jgi:DNA-binding MarR family transcriptional regulator
MTKVSLEPGLDGRHPVAIPREVVRAVADLVSLVEPRLLALWQDAGMTLSQRRVLGRLRGGPKSAGDIASGLGISSPSLTRMLTKLEERGLIVRALDSGDRRRILVGLTAKGERLIDDHRIFKGTSLARAARNLSADDQRSLTESVATLVRLARELDEGDADD